MIAGLVAGAAAVGALWVAFATTLDEMIAAENRSFQQTKEVPCPIDTANYNATRA